MLQPQPLVFTEDSPFVLADNRRRRPVLPTTAAALNRRHGLLFPERVVAGARVLDLGCCIGATGAWVQAQGAAQYVGVEHQERYVEKARQLLAFWPQAPGPVRRGRVPCPAPPASSRSSHCSASSMGSTIRWRS